MSGSALSDCGLIQFLHSTANKGFRWVSNSNIFLRGGLLHVIKSLALNYWPSITSNFGTLIKRKCFIESLTNLEASEVPLYVIKNVKFVFEVIYTPNMWTWKKNWNQFLLVYVTFIRLLFKHLLCTFHGDVARCHTSRPWKGLRDICFS